MEIIQLFLELIMWNIMWNIMYTVLSKQKYRVNGEELPASR